MFAHIPVRTLHILGDPGLPTSLLDVYRSSYSSDGNTPTAELDELAIKVPTPFADFEEGDDLGRLNDELCAFLISHHVHSKPPRKLARLVLSENVVWARENEEWLRENVGHLEISPGSDDADIPRRFDSAD